MTDDWEQFSASPHTQASPSVVQQATSPFLIFDWPDQLAVVNAMLLSGKKGIWIDLTGAEQLGLSGQNIQNTLENQGIAIHAKALYPLDRETVVAIIVVDAENEDRAREILGKMGILIE